MRSLNKVMLIGHLGKDPEIQHLEGGTALAKFSLATNESYTDKTGNRIDQTEWHNIVCWRKLAEICEKYLNKGSYVYIEGKVKTRSWDDKDGNKRYTTEVVADQVFMLDKKGEGGNSSGQPAASESAVSSSEGEDVADDLPF